MLRKLSKRAGISTPTIIALAGGSMMLGLGVTSLTMTQDQNSGRSATKSQANDLAEAAVNNYYDLVRSQLRIDKTIPSGGGYKDYSVATRSHGEQVLGKFMAYSPRYTISSTTVAAAEGNVATRKTYTFTIEGRGLMSNGVESRIRAVFTGSLDESDGTYKQTVWGKQSDGNGVPFAVCPGALMSNGAIRFTSNGGIRTFATNNDGHVVANKGIEWNPSSGSKTAVTNPSVIDIQGQYQVPGSAEYAAIYDFTVGPSGLGNPSGAKNYRSPDYPAADGNPPLAANTVARRQYPRPYPSPTMFDEWEVEMRAQGDKGTKYPGDVNTSSMPGRAGDGWKIIKAPAVIDGDLKISNAEDLRLMPTSEKPWENIVYVTGDVRNLGNLKNLGVTLVILGKYQDENHSKYEIDTQESPYGTRESVLQHANFLSLNRDADAVTINSNEKMDSGLIYAARGGVRVHGSCEITGKLVAAGSQDMVINPNGNEFTLRYEPLSGGNRHIVGSAEDHAVITLPAGTVVRQFDADRLKSWFQVK